MNLIGQKVKHASLGVGTIVEIPKEQYIKVKFANKEMLFQCPQAFEKFLVAEDDNLQEELIKEIEGIKAAIAAEKAAKAAEIAKATSDEMQSKKSTSNSKKYIPVTRAEGQAFTFLVFQGGTFKEESEGHFIWAPKYNRKGDTCFHWDNLMEVREGDIILNCVDGYIKAVSIANGSCTECNRPVQYADDVEGLWAVEGRKVECEYYIIDNPIKTSDFKNDISTYCNVKYAPFDKDGNGNMGYLYMIDSRLASIFLQASVAQNPGLKNLSNINWLL